MQNESEDLKKYLFIITDRFEEQNYYRFEKSLFFNERERLNVNFYVFSDDFDNNCQVFPYDFEIIKGELEKIGKYGITS